MARFRPTHDGPEDDSTVTHDTGARDADYSIGIPGYQVLRELHRGGQGIVYLALQQSTQRKVAIKILHDDSRDTPLARQRFEREIELIAQLNHPNIIEVYDSGVMDNGRMYCVMEYIRGDTLLTHIHKFSLCLNEALKLFVKICEALQHAHGRGVVHRDLKPANILVDYEGRVKVLDFGLAKPIGLKNDSIRSITGQFMGSLRYTSPEQLRADTNSIDTRTDVYALGVILYEMLTGRFPYPETENLAEWATHVTERAPTSPRMAWDSSVGIHGSHSSQGSATTCPIGLDLQTIVLKSLSKLKNRRYRNAGEFGRDIIRCLRDQPIEARENSLAYLLGVEFRRFGDRHQLTLYAVLIVASVCFVLFVGSPFISTWTELNRDFESRIALRFAPDEQDLQLDTVRVVALTNGETVALMAEKAQISGVSIGNLKSLRRLHGSLMKQLSRSQCKVVAFDIFFRSSSEFDDSFLDGVKALNQAGIDVVLALPSWWLDDSMLPQLSTLIAPHVRFGGVMVRLVRSPYSAQIVVRRGLGDPQPSFAMETFAAYRSAGKQYSIRWNQSSNYVELVYWSPDIRMPKLRRTGNHVDHIWLTGESSAHRNHESFQGAVNSKWGLLKSDDIGYRHIVIPSDDMLANATVDYAEVIGATDQQLAEWFAGKIVVVGDARPGIDRHVLADSREISGCYAHASLIESLVKDTVIFMLSRRGEIVTWLMAALLGCFTAVVVPWRVAAKILLLLIYLPVVFYASVTAYHEYSYLYNPSAAILALIISFVLCLSSRRYCNSHRFD